MRCHSDILFSTESYLVASRRALADEADGKV